MSHDSNNPNPSLAELLRCAADDELTPAQREALDAHLAANPKDADRIEFELRLRAASARVMGDVAAPASLRARVAAAIAEPDAAPAQTIHAARREVTRQTSHRALWTRASKVQAVAAAFLLLIGGTFLFQMFRIGSAQSNASTALADVATYVQQEHNTCQRDPARAAKFTVTAADRVPEIFERIVGRSPTLPDLLASGMVFVGAGECAVPGGGKSVHLRFRTDEDPAIGVEVSLFVQAASGDGPEMVEGRSYRTRCRKDQRRDNVVYAWRYDGLNYYLVADRAELGERIRASSDIPGPIDSP